MSQDSEAERIRALILLNATCETLLARLDENDSRDAVLIAQTTELCTTVSDELARLSSRLRSVRNE